MLSQRPLVAFAARVAVFGALASLVVASAWLFGGALTEHQVLFAAAGIVSLFGAAAVCWWDPQIPTVPWLTAVLAGAILLAGTQLVSLSNETLTSISPKAAAIRQDLQGDVAMDRRPDQGTTSLYPSSTRRDLARLILPCAVFLAAVVPLGVAPWQRAFCWFLTGHGMILALFGIVQHLTFNGKLFWTVTLAQGGTPFASFVNRNHAAAYLNLCLAGLIALLAWEFRRRERSADEGDAQNLSAGQPWMIRAADRLSEHLGSLTGTVLWLGLAAVIIIAGVLCTTSRGGIAALILAGIATSLLMVFRNFQKSAWVFVVTAVVGVAMTCWVGQGESVAQRIEELGTDWRQATSSRWNHWRQSVTIVPDFAVTGSGLGTYRYIYPLYQVEYLPAWYYHAENQYLEAAVEAGLPGLLLLLTAIGFALYYSVRKINSGPTEWSAALGLGGTFAVLVAALHAGVDFNLYMPANAFLLAILVAMQIGRPSSADGVSSISSISRRLLWMVCLSVMLGASLWSWSQLRRYAKSEGVRRAWDHDRELGIRDEARVDESLGRLIRVTNDDADDEAAIAAMRLWKYRVQAWQALQQELGESAQLDLLWDSTDPQELHRRLHATGKRGATALANFPALRDQLKLAAAAYEQAVMHCPMRATFHLALARLAPLTSSAETERQYLERAVRVAPADSDVLFQAGRLAYQAGWQSTALDWWNRSLRYSDRRMLAILRLFDAADEEGLRSGFKVLFDGIPHQAVEAARVSHRTPGLRGRTPLIAAVARDLVQQTQLDPPVRELLLGRLAASTGQLDEAIEHIEQAVTAQPEMIAWRAELAELLMQAERYADAYRHARICFESQPTNASYRRLQQRASRSLDL